MNLRLLSIVTLLFGSMAMLSCIDDDATNEVILEKDITALEGYLEKNTLVNVKEVYDESSGLRIIWQKIADDSAKAVLSDTLQVDYIGKFLDNRVFDTSIESVAKENNLHSTGIKYMPLEFPLGYGHLIFGFEWGAMQMKVGEKATILVPSQYAYGRQGNAGIPANTPIVFELDLIKVTEGPREK